MSAITRALCSLCIIGVGSAATADSLSDANRLLRVTDTGLHFESRAQQQARDIIRTFASIVSISTDLALPGELRQAIAECYARAYEWDRFQPGIARILAESLTEKELRLLIDFYQHRGLPPTEIDTFRSIIARAGEIERDMNQYLFEATEGCIEQGTMLVLDFLTQQTRQADDRRQTP